MRTLVISPDSCIDLRGTAYKFCLPAMRFCAGDREVGGLITEVGTAWCDLCPGDEKFMIPYLPGDVIHLQTRFFDSYNPDRQEPTNGFGTFIRAFATDGTTPTEITTGMVAWGCDGSFQVLEIDTATIPIDCWAIEFRIFNQDGTVRRTLQSEQFRAISQADCAKTILVEGVGSGGVDCFGYCYDKPDAYHGPLIQYSNKLRIPATVFRTGGAIEKTTKTDKRFSSTTTEAYRFLLGRKVPPYLFEIITKQWLSAPAVFFDDQEFELQAANIDNDVTRGRMFFFGVDLERICKSGGRC